MTTGAMRRLAAWRRRDEGVAMMSAILMVLLMGALSTIILALVMSQVTPTQFARKNTRTIFAAEAGVEAALSQIRSAAAAPDFTGEVYGSLAALPCTLTGTVADSGGDLRYDVQVRYYKENPAGRTETWLAANAMSCRPVQQPAYAYVMSEGYAENLARLEATSGDRTLASVYQFKTTNSNIAGGRIYTFGDGFCLRADGITVGSTIRYVDKADCGSDDEHELFLYDTDYAIKLASSTLPGSTPLCLTGPPSTSSGSVQITLQVCQSGSARWNQLFSWEGGSRWKGENTSITNYSSYCLFSGSTSNTGIAGRKLYVGTSCAQDQPWGSFNPDPAVGAGAASITTRQVVNYLEFGRCFDVTGGNVSAAYMIVYPCKQDPSGGTQLNWNHKWYYSEPAVGSPSLGPQQIYILQNNSTSSKYCLQSPAAGGQYVTLTSACSTSAANQRWTRYQDTGNYGTSYTFVDYLGRCIGLGDKFNGSWSKMVVSSCTGGVDQKWNAPPLDVEANVGDYVETYGG